VLTTLRTGSERTNGASINTGTDTRNTAAANTNQICRASVDMAMEGDKAISVDSNSLMFFGLTSGAGKSVLITVVAVVWEDKMLLIKDFNICY
jgi:hypothetical protein